MSYMSYCPMILRSQLPSKEKLFNSITMRSREYYIFDRMTKSCSIAFHTKRHRRHSRKLTMAHAKQTNPNPNLGTDFEDLANIGQRWFLTLLPTPSGVTPIRFMVTSSIKHQVISIRHFLSSHLRCGEWMSLDP